MTNSKTLLAIFAVSTLTACTSSDSVKNTDGDTIYANVGQPKESEKTTTSGVSLSKAERVLSTPSELISENKSELSKLKTVVYFDYDTSTLSEETRVAIQAHADFLVKNDATVTLHGHTDARGTQEYNIALGERRGNAVKTYLMNAGVPSSVITVVSFGEEKPIALGASEFDYAQNRRVVFKY